MDKFHLVVEINSNRLSKDRVRTYTRHDAVGTARDEAVRLAKANPGKVFGIMSLESAFVHQDVVELEVV